MATGRVCANHAVLGNTELLELILLQVAPGPQVFLSQRVSRFWQAVIQGSTRIRREHFHILKDGVHSSDMKRKYFARTLTLPLPSRARELVNSRPCSYLLIAMPTETSQSGRDLFVRINPLILQAFPKCTHRCKSCRTVQDHRLIQGDKHFVITKHGTDVHVESELALFVCLVGSEKTAETPDLWYNMLLTDPPTKAMKLFAILGRGRRSPVCLSFEVATESHLTLGHFHDLIKGLRGGAKSWLPMTVKVKLSIESLKRKLQGRLSKTGDRPTGGK